MKFVLYSLKTWCQTCRTVDCKSGHATEPYYPYLEETIGTNAQAYESVKSSCEEIVSSRVRAGKVYKRLMDFVAALHNQLKGRIKENDEHIRKISLLKDQVLHLERQRLSPNEANEDGIMAKAMKEIQSFSEK